MVIDYCLYLNTSDSKLEFAQLLGKLGDIDSTPHVHPNGDVELWHSPYFIILIYETDARQRAYFSDKPGIVPELWAIFTFNGNDSITESDNEFFRIVAQLITVSDADFIVDRYSDNYDLVQKAGKLYIDYYRYKWDSDSTNQIKQTGKEITIINVPDT
jgi:hypothetical protein